MVSVQNGLCQDILFMLRATKWAIRAEKSYNIPLIYILLTKVNN